MTAARTSGCIADSEPPDDDDFDLDRAIEDEADYFAGDSAPSILLEEEPAATCTVSAAKRARTQIMQDNARAVRSANADSAISSAAISRQAGVAVDYDPSALPEWTRRADNSHDLLWFWGFLFCGRCGGVAAYDIGTFKLRHPCGSHPTANGRRSISALSKGRLPPGYAGWPDGGDAKRDGLEVRRVT